MILHFFNNLLTEKWPDIYKLLDQFSWGHNQTQKVAYQIQRITKILHDMQKLEIFTSGVNLGLPGTNVS